MDGGFLWFTVLKEQLTPKPTFLVDKVYKWVSDSAVYNPNPYYFVFYVHLSKIFNNFQPKMTSVAPSSG